MPKRLRCLLAGLLAGLLLCPVTGAAQEEAGPKAQLLMELSSGQILWEEAGDEALPMASLTKLMGLLLVGEALDKGELSLEERLCCSAYAKSMGGSEIWLREGETMTVEELLKAVLIASANDAMVVFAERLGGSEEGFVQQMNEKAEELGLENTHYVNATGFDEAGHYTCARDVARLAQELQAYPELLSYASIWMDSLRDGETMLVNTNRLVRFYEGCTGLKTGTTEEAGHCLCATAQRGELSLCAVVLGCSSSEERFESAKALLDRGFGGYCVLRPQAPELEPLPLIHGTAETVELYGDPPELLILRREEGSALETKVPQLEPVEAPVEAGQELGQVELLGPQGQLLASYPIRAKESVGALDFGTCWGLLFKSLCCGGRNC